MKSAWIFAPALAALSFSASGQTGATPAQYSFSISDSQIWTDTGVDLAAGDSLSITAVSVEKVSQLMLVAVEGSGYKQARVLDAAVHHNIGRPAAHDGTPFPRGVAVLLLPARRSCS